VETRPPGPRMARPANGIAGINGRHLVPSQTKRGNVKDPGARHGPGTALEGSAPGRRSDVPDLPPAPGPTGRSASCVSSGGVCAWRLLARVSAALQGPGDSTRFLGGEAEAEPVARRPGGQRAPADGLAGDDCMGVPDRGGPAGRCPTDCPVEPSSPGARTAAAAPAIARASNGGTAFPVWPKAWLKPPRKM
jgi:hypothetical protein